MMGKQTGKIQMIILEGIYMSYKQMNCKRYNTRPSIHYEFLR